MAALAVFPELSRVGNAATFHPQIDAAHEKCEALLFSTAQNGHFAPGGRLSRVRAWTMRAVPALVAAKAAPGRITF